MTNAALTMDEAHALVVRDERLEQLLRVVETLDFTMLKKKLAMEDGWTIEIADEAEALYRKFLALQLRYPERTICPTKPIDEFWHAHILDTAAYARDCQALFGAPIHHYPYFGMRGPEDKEALELAFDQTVDLFIRHFGVDITAGDSHARSCRPQRCP